MSNITAARAALVAELQHAQHGMQFYTTRIETFEKLLAQLAGVDAAVISPASGPGQSKRAYKRAGAASVTRDITTDSMVITAPGGTGKADLPATRGDFWKNLLSEVPMSNQDILKAATTALKIRPNPEALKKLKQRLANALTMMTKDGSIKSDGSGRARRFSRTG